MTVVKCLNEGNASNIVIVNVQFLPSLYVTLVDYLGSIAETIDNVLFIIIHTKQSQLFEFQGFFEFARKK